MQQLPELTEAEKQAKEYMTRMVIEASAKPCDTGGALEPATLPEWYDEIAYKRGQQYFRDNRLGVLGSNLCGLLTLLAEPRGLQMLASTGRSSTVETARKRYVSTILHVLRWYEFDLTPGSDSWASLVRVRQMHQNASNCGPSRGLGHITQAEVALTTFGFMGFVLIRPHMLGIRHDCDADRTAFVHFWAVMGHMLGVADTYNMCRQPLPVVEIVCQMMLRYIFIPLIQVESPPFRRMVEALCAGMSQFMPHMSYELQMFSVKRVCGVPGYQYDVDASKETLCRQLFSDKEAHDLRKAVFRNVGYEFGDITFGAGVPLIEVRRWNGDADAVAEFGEEISEFYGKLSDDKKKSMTPLQKLLELNDRDRFNIRVAYPEREGWAAHLNDTEFYRLSAHDRFVVRCRVRLIRLYEYSMVRYLSEAGLSLMLYMMQRWYGTKRAAMASG